MHGMLLTGLEITCPECVVLCVVLYVCLSAPAATSSKQQACVTALHRMLLHDGFKVMETSGPVDTVDLLAGITRSGLCAAESSCVRRAGGRAARGGGAGDVGEGGGLSGKVPGF